MGWVPYVIGAVLAALGLIGGKLWSAKSQGTTEAKREDAATKKSLEEIDATKAAKVSEAKTAGELAAQKEREAHEARARAIEAEAAQKRDALVAAPDELPGGLVESLARASKRGPGGGGGGGGTAT